MMIGDLIEETGCLDGQQRAACDAALRGQKLPTLTEVRAQFCRRVRAILNRDELRNDDDYYALRNVADALPDGERQRAWEMLDGYMTGGTK